MTRIAASALRRTSLSLAALLAAGGAAGAAELTPRAPAQKQSYSSMAAQASSERVTVKFREGLKVRADGAGVKGLAADEAAALRAALVAAGAGPAAIRRLHNVPEAQLDAERAEGEAESGRQLADLNLYYVIKLPAGANAAAVADRLNRLSFVEYAAPVPLPPPPPVDIAPETPKFVAMQGYAKGKGRGIGALDPKDYPGADGKGVRVVDIEYEWRFDHEDLELPADRMLTDGETPGQPFNDTNHGTAVLGEMVGKKNKYGVTGLAAEAKAYVSPQVTVESGYTTARAITTGGAVLRKGDVMILEAQYPVCGTSAYGPIETLQDVFDAVSTLTARGVIVTAAAGNGNVNLDDPSCGGKFDRSQRDSGAIIVGAGSSAARSRLSFSSYGSRVDVQGWGENVTTTGYGVLFTGEGDPRQYYTNRFNGTSSATPIVTGAVLAIQGVRKACGLKPLSPAKMRQTLRDTGTPQGPGAGQIGPLPNILPALRASEDTKRCIRKLGREGASAEAETAALD